MDLRLLAVMNNPVSFIISDSCATTCDSTGDSSLLLIRMTSVEEVATALAQKEGAAAAASHDKQPQSYYYSLVSRQNDGTGSLGRMQLPGGNSLLFFSPSTLLTVFL